MTNRVFESMLDEQISIFINSFINTSRLIFYNEDSRSLIHPGEYGSYRENICKDFLRFFIPRRLEIDEGFVINRNNQISTQCDLVVYDYNETPLIQSGERQRFFPVETVIAVGEVKSILSKTQFVNAINKLAEVKKLRENMPATSVIRKENKSSFDPTKDAHDQLFTFIICQKLDFDLKEICNEINQMYNKNVEYRNRHNMILSLEDGLMLYKLEKPIHYPITSLGNSKNFFQKPSDSKSYSHIRVFSHYLFMATSSATILYPEMNGYIGNFGETEFFEEKDDA